MDDQDGSPLPRRLRPLCACARANGATFPRLNPPTTSTHSLRCFQSSVSKPHGPRVADGDPMCFFCRRIDPCANRPHLTWPFIDFIDTVENIGAHNRPCARAPCLLCRYASAAGPSCLLHATLNLTAHPLHMPTTIRAHHRVLGYLAPSQVHSSAACFMPLVLQSVAPPSVAILMATSSMAIVGRDLVAM